MKHFLRTAFFPFLAIGFFAHMLNAQSVSFPVVFHVLYNTTAQNLPDTVLLHQLDVLNEDYQAMNADIVNVPAAWQPIIGNMDIGFEFAAVDPQGNPTIGIERRQIIGSPNPFDPHSFANGGLDPWPDSAYLNIWVYDLPGGLLAYATFPDNNPNTVNGLDLDWTIVGRNDANTIAPYNKGRTATHEMAHFFGLRHIWGDDGNSCTGTDNIADTPNQASETYGNPGVGTVITDACTPVAPGIMWMNFLDFTDDAAMCFFTQGQVVEVTNNINTYYASFVVPAGVRNVAAGNQSQYSVFPSPSSTGVFQINRTDIHTTANVEVYDLQGRLIIAPQQFGNGSATMQVDLSAFGNGMYSVIIRSAGATETKRVVIAR